MSIIEAVSWLIPETIKYLLITIGILGFNSKEGVKKYVVILYPVLGMIGLVHGETNPLIWRTFWGLVLIVVFFDGKLTKKLQAYILEWLVISSVDILVGNILISVKGVSIYSNYWEQNICEYFAIIIWVVTVLFIKKQNIDSKKAFKELSGKYFGSIIIVIIGINIVVASVEQTLLGNLTENMKKTLIVASSISLVIIIMGCVVLLHAIYSKKNLECKSRINERQLSLQKKYYEKIISQDEELRSFRHDITNHIRTLSLLCFEKKYEEIQKYISNINDDYLIRKVVYTGNVIADYFISETLEKIRKKGPVEFNISGKLPIKLKMSDSDFCVLWANALDNVREALELVEENRVFDVHIKIYQDKIFIKIVNTAMEKDGKLLDTLKEDKDNHGYGTENMKRIVKKYHGQIEWKYEKGLFKLKISI